MPESVDLDGGFEVLEYLVLSVGLLNLVLVDEQLHMHVLNDLSAFHCHVQDAEGLQTLHDLSEHVRWDLVLATTEETRGVTRRFAPVELHEHVVAAILDAVEEHLLELGNKEL